MLPLDLSVEVFEFSLITAGLLHLLPQHFEFFSEAFGPTVEGMAGWQDGACLNSVVGKLSSPFCRLGPGPEFIFQYPVFQCWGCWTQIIYTHLVTYT